MFGMRKRFLVEAEDSQEAAQNEQLERAEDALSTLTRRGEVAVRTLDARDGRNHWGESIERMIMGV